MSSYANVYKYIEERFIVKSEHTASIPVLTMDPLEGKVSWSRRPVAVGPYKVLESNESLPQMPSKARKVNASYSSIKPYY